MARRWLLRQLLRSQTFDTPYRNDNPSQYFYLGPRPEAVNRKKLIEDECEVTTDCPSHLACRESKCIDPCIHTPVKQLCDENASCRIRHTNVTDDDDADDYDDYDYDYDCTCDEGYEYDYDSETGTDSCTRIEGWEGE